MTALFPLLIPMGCMLVMFRFGLWARAWRVLRDAVGRLWIATALLASLLVLGPAPDRADAGSVTGTYWSCVKGVGDYDVLGNADGNWDYGDPYVFALKCYISPEANRHALARLADLAAGTGSGSYFYIPGIDYLQGPFVNSSSWEVPGQSGNFQAIAVEHGDLSTTHAGGASFAASNPSLPDNYFVLSFSRDCAYCGAGGAPNANPNDLGFSNPFCDSGGSNCFNYINVGFDATSVYTLGSSGWLSAQPDSYVGQADYPDPVCHGFTFGDWTHTRSGSSSSTSHATLAGVPNVGPGDLLGFTVEHELGLAPLPVDATLSYRWGPGQAWASVGTFSEGDVLVSRTFSVTRSGESVQATSLELRCQSLGDDDAFWQNSTGWSGSSGAWACEGYDISISVGLPPSDYDDIFTWMADNPTRFSIFDPETIQVIVDHPGPVVGFARFALRVGGVFADERLDVFPDTEDDLPLPFFVTPPEDDVDGYDLRDIEVVCQDGVGRTFGVWDADSGEFVPELPGGTADSAGCFTFSGMSLTSPASWLRGGGNMLVCLGEWLFVPSGDEIPDAWDGLYAAAVESVPFAWVAEAHSLLSDAAEGTAASIEANEDGCLEVLPEAPDIGAEAGCVEVDGTYMTPMRPVLGVAVWAFWAWSMLGVIFPRKAPESNEPEQLTLF